MYTFHCLVIETNKDFYRTYYSQYQARLFRNKCKYSKKIVILSYTGDLDC